MNYFKYVKYVFNSVLKKGLFLLSWNLMQYKLLLFKAILGHCDLVVKGGFGASSLIAQVILQSFSKQTLFGWSLLGFPSLKSPNRALVYGRCLFCADIQPISCNVPSYVIFHKTRSSPSVQLNVFYLISFIFQ